MDNKTQKFINAIYTNQYNDVQKLIEEGIDINMQDGFALTHALSNCRFKMVKLLINNGAKISEKNELSMLTNNLDMFNFALENGVDVFKYMKKIFNQAIIHNNLEIIKLLVIEYNQDIDLVLNNTISMSISPQKQDNIIQWAKEYKNVKNLRDKLENDLIPKVKNIKVKI